MERNDSTRFNATLQPKQNAPYPMMSGLNTDQGLSRTLGNFRNLNNRYQAAGQEN